MCSIEKKYEEFTRLVTKDSRYTNKDFPAICKELKVPPCALNELIMKELGISGEELLEKYHKFTTFVSFARSKDT